MLKNEFVTKIKEELENGEEKIEISKKDLTQVVEAISTVLKNAALDGDEVTIPGVCKIGSKDVPERSGVTKMDGVEKAWVKPAGKVGYVKALPSFKKIFE